MSDFLDTMAAHSRERVAAAQREESETALRARAEASAPAPGLAPAAAQGAPSTFHLIAEVKLRSPAAGALASGGQPLDALAERALGYAAGGASAISVLTEPSRFDGSLDHLAAVAAALAPTGIPAMRKDFLVAPYQLYEARAAGAGGALLILAMLDDATLGAMLELARELGLFVLLEAFDAAELDRAGAVLAHARHGEVLVGLNSRDLRTLEVEPGRFAALADRFPPGFARIAESGVGDGADAARIAAMGYTGALVGSALMQAEDAPALVQQMLQHGRAAATGHAAP
ncbi:MAG: indole-3-glycerol phosphate synthase TrpC [Pseudomonadota bacterium]